MHEMKREHFRSAHPDVPFPEVVALDDREAARLRARIAERVRVSERDGLTLVKAIAARAVPVDGVRAGDEDFRLLGVFWSLRLRPDPQVYVNWYRFDQIDRISVQDLAKFFDDIWYPSSDDIDIFDESCDWILSVGHSGDVRITRLGTRATGGG